MPEEATGSAERRSPEEPGPQADARFLAIFDALRERPGGGRHRRLARMERRAARRRRVRVHDGVQRGDLAEPPPVLDLVLDDAADRDALLDALVERCGNQPPWRLPPDAGDTLDGPPDIRDLWATTDELYDLVRALLEAGDAARPGAEGVRTPPPPPRFARLRSLLRLRDCDRRAVHESMQGSVAGQGDLELDTDRRTQIHVVAALLRIRTEARRSGETNRAEAGRGSWFLARWAQGYVRIARRAAIWVAALSAKVTFSRLDEKLLTPLSFVVGALAFLGPFALGAFGLAALFGSALQGVNNWVTVGAAVLLLIVHISLAPFLFLPWRAYRWLDDHADYEERPLGDHRARGVHVLNLLKSEAGRVGRLYPLADRTPPRPGPVPSVPRRPGLLRPLLGLATGRSADAPTEPPAAATAPRPESVEGPPRGYEPLPAVHRLIVNALLDDLADSHGGSARSRSPRRGRAQRPVLLVDQDRLGRVGRYLVRLIEDERVRRTLPDPLLIVQVRASDGTSLVDPNVNVLRYPSLPGTETDGRQEELSLWLRARHAAGVLGAARTLSVPVPRPPDDLDGPGPADRTVLTAGALASAWIGGTGAGLSLLLLLLWAFGPAVMAPVNPCVQSWVWDPVGIRQDGRDCYGLTFGDFVFHERLTEVTEHIREQNEAVDKAGRDTTHVTVAYFGALSTTGANDLTLAGVQGELLGIAHRQAQHNASADASLPRIKIMLVNTGQGWSRAREAAEMVVERAVETHRRMDRPVAALGFGQSLQGTTDAIRVLGGARIPTIGTTATFDDIALDPSGKYGQYFFPLAPANSRIAEQAAAWAYHGVEWSGTELVEGEPAPDLEPARTAVAIADNRRGESYGPHLAVRFMTGFRELGGEPWADPEGGDPPPVGFADGSTGVVPGVLPYQDGGVSLAAHLARVCAQDPPDLIYFAGRSTDFAEFHRQLQQEGMCVEAGIDVLGGDDIAKFVTDHAETIGMAGGYPVFYTPLAASGAWSRYTEGSERAFYAEAEALVEELYADPDDGEGGPPGIRADLDAADGGSPSMTHAAVAADALTVLSRALRGIDRTTTREASVEGPAVEPSPFLGTDDGYEAERDALVERIQNTSGLSAVSGHIAFGEPALGNWHPERMVQLVVVGPLGADGLRQHVVAACGRISAATIDPGPGCV
ncbi:hypothetical protein PWG71_05050 [Nocardiopsis sp. N85]|uniref:hypothetical protein n=1 Tax=Nocardiopsis sp. N85 TaxID=3029400 RepID=UPI00237FD0A3|nr:hypothetical protein [Nocardiopsis sp. N85]MDE3720745.1 hypothetical protein [Nocardiopsis sp. N85]